jgi:lipopolysaccharide export LptBFGC system permease protein LptF
VQVNMAEGTGRAQRRLSSRLIITTALVVICVAATLLVVGTSLTPSANAMIALVLFGGLLGAFFLWQRLMAPRDGGVVEEAIAGEESDL